VAAPERPTRTQRLALAGVAGPVLLAGASLAGVEPRSRLALLAALL